MDRVHQFAEKGYRVIAAATGIWQQTELPGNQEDFTFSFIGLVGFEDPIREEVPRAIKECNEAGIKVIMVTGDYPATAKSIADQIGLVDEGMVLTGSDLHTMTDDDLKVKIRNTRVFARIVPEQKLQIIRALKANGEIVAMTGGLKNALEWSVATTLFSEKPCGLITASASGQKGHEELQLVIKTLMAKFTDETTLLIQGVKGKFDERKNLRDPETIRKLNDFIDAYKRLVMNI